MENREFGLAGHRLLVERGIQDGCQKKSPVLPGEAVASIQPQRPSVGGERDVMLVPFPQRNPGYCQVQTFVAERFEGEFNPLHDAVNERKGAVDLFSKEKSLVQPRDVSQSLQSESVPPIGVVCKVLDLSSLKAPGPEDRK
ncbi:hypothetical protein AWC38_SpisGene21125 [Stylophora pistillata]|uniref:Uncharacterized protein n=1 Tax=Stylophora pistillata TaxID=50429 RepID=A0A2B4RD23_STYPI|nr:hypothetical protein AWC38_SpisGene21125 [Stylophora pistillata]